MTALVVISCCSRSYSPKLQFRSSGHTGVVGTVRMSDLNENSDAGNSCYSAGGSGSDVPKAGVDKIRVLDTRFREALQLLAADSGQQSHRSPP